ASTRRELRSAATSTSTTAIDLIRALTDARPIKPTSTRCLSARRPNPGRGSTYRRGNSVQTTAATSKVEFMVGVVMYFCSGARNLPACKGKSLRCLRKCRFSYIGTSPAPSARRHLTAALRYSACPPHRPSCLHLGCQTHQTWCAPRHLGAAPCQLVACSA